MFSNFDRKNCAILAGSTIAVYYLSTKLYRYYEISQYSKNIKNRERLRNANFEIVRNLIFTDDFVDLQKRRAITEMGFESLRAALQNDELTPGEVLKAFQWKALEAHQITNCICDFIQEAHSWCLELEETFRNSQNKPPLYGIPMSFKECNFIKGYDATTGLAQYINVPAEQDSDMVKILKAQGAVPFVTTNVPQTMMSIGSSNPVYGITTCPHNADLSSGGSSSGEGALIGCRGSFLGIGSDIGGSVRVPAHCCGICSLKPTCGRIPWNGQRGPELGISLVPATIGPMGVDVDSLIWFCRSVWSKDTKIADPTVVPLHFREDVLSNDSKLTIGYYDDDGFVETTPACKRAVQTAKDILVSMGHNLVRFDPPHVSELMSCYLACILPDSGHYLGSLYHSDYLDQFHSKSASFCSMPLALKKISGMLLKPFSSQLSMKYGSFPANPAEMRTVFNSMYEYRTKFIEHFKNANLDCILCPVMASPALSPECMSKMFALGWHYTALYNALNFPAGVVPCIMTNQTDDENMKFYKAETYYAKQIKKSFENTTKKPVSVGVQLVTLPYHEELCLRVMKELEVGLKEKIDI